MHHWSILGCCDDVVKCACQGMVCNTGAGLPGPGRVGMELQHLLRLAPCPFCIFQRLLYGHRPARTSAVCAAGGRLLWSVLIDRLAGLVWRCCLQTWMQAYPHLAPECSFDRTRTPSSAWWTGWACRCRPVPGNRACTSREWEFLGLSMANWSTLFLCRYRRLRHPCCSGSNSGLQKQNPPKGGFVECWNETELFQLHFLVSDVLTGLRIVLHELQLFRRRALVLGGGMK